MTVDDILIVSKNKTTSDQLVVKLKQKCELTDQGTRAKASRNMYSDYTSTTNATRKS